MKVKRVLGDGFIIEPDGRRRSCLVAECYCGQLMPLHSKTVQQTGSRLCNCPVQEREEEPGLVERKCKRCGEWWLLEQFSQNGAGDRLSMCNVCRPGGRGRKKSPRREGEKTLNARRKLSAAEVREIRRLCSVGAEPQWRIGARYGVTQTAVSNLFRGRTYREVVD